MLELMYNNKYVASFDPPSSLDDLCNVILMKIGCPEFYLIHNGRRVTEDDCFNNGIYHIVPRQPGGKGGFGSMLRAIGAQIEKTTNREACRDLSGRRLRDINEEKRLKAWIDKQANREQEAEDRKVKKLERLVHTPKHEFKDEVYDKERANLSERLEDAVTQGMMEAAASSSTGQNLKRKSQGNDQVVKKKKLKTLWFDEGLDISSSDEHSTSNSDADDEEEIEKEKIKLAA